MPILSKTPLLYWTHHSRAKMRQYRLSEARVKRVLHSPKRIEEGIAPKTIAMMQPASLRRTIGKTDWNQEIWIMLVQEKRNGLVQRRIISAWRYPGKTRPGEQLPSEIIREIQLGIKMI